MIKIGDKLPTSTLMEYLKLKAKAAQLVPMPLTQAKPVQARRLLCLPCPVRSRLPALPSMCLATWRNTKN